MSVSNPFSVSFISMKIRYNVYDSTISELNFVNNGDIVNVFINFESVLNNLSTVKDIENKLLLERNFTTILESEAINLCAHYKNFFRCNGLQTRVFLYYTDLDSKVFSNFKYNDEYRSFYINKYLSNPKYQLLGNKLIEKVIPRIQKIMEFIPNVYFIKATGIEGSLVPLIIANQDTKYKNFIVSTDKYDTQYLLNDRFCVHYISKSIYGTNIYHKYSKYIAHLLKDNSDESDDMTLFTNESFYSLLLAMLGNKSRSIDPIKGFGCKTVSKALSSAISDGLITKTTSSCELIAKAFQEEYHERLYDNFSCVNLQKQYNDISQSDIFNIINQIQDRSDYNSLIALNNQDYKDYPLMLPELTS